MRVKEIMRSPTFVNGLSSIREVAELMDRLNIGSVIVGTAEKPEGIVTERDIFKKVIAAGLNPERSIRNIMTKNVVTIHMDESLEKAMGILNERGFRRLPVVDNKGKITGVISARKLLHAFRLSYLKQLGEIIR